MAAWRRERGSARGYINDETGQRLSRRAYDAMQEQANKRTHLDLVELANYRLKSKKYNDLVNARYKEVLNEGLSALDTTNLTLVEESKRISEYQKSVSKQAIRTDKEFKQLFKDLKKLGKKKPENRTPQETRRLTDILETLGRRHGIPKNVQPGESDYFKRGLMRKAKSGMYVMKKSKVHKVATHKSAPARAKTTGTKRR